MKAEKKMKFVLKKETLFGIFAIAIFLFSLFLYTKGSFAYPYLEDEDPWEHAKSTKFIAVEKTLRVPNYLEDKFFVYINPYPPAYDAIMGVLHQTSASVSWTLKFFNALIISLGILFFYYFARNFMKNRAKALFATFVLAMVPSYLSHFIWAHALIPAIFFVSMYCLEKINEDRKWVYISAVPIASIIVTHPTQAIKIGIMWFFYFAVLAFYDRKILKYLAYAFLIGFIVSMVWWAPVVMQYGGVKGVAAVYSPSIAATNATGNETVAQRTFMEMLKGRFSPTAGTATRAYTFEDFFVAKSKNMINNPVGIGVIASVVVFISLIYVGFRFRKLRKPENSWIIITLLWLLFTFFFVNSMTFNLPIGFEAFRMWMLLAIPIALVSGELVELMMIKPNIGKIVLFLFVVGIILTSGVQKYQLNNMQWPPGVKWRDSYDELYGYMWMKENLPANSNVFSYSVYNKVVIGMDMYACVWCEDYARFHDDVLLKNVSDVYSWLKSNGYDYLVFGAMDYRALGNRYENASEMLSTRIQEIGSSGRFKVEYQNNGMVLFKVI